MTYNFRKFTFHFGSPRNRAVLSFHKDKGTFWGIEVKMYGFAHPKIGFIGVMTFSPIA